MMAKLMLIGVNLIMKYLILFVAFFAFGAKAQQVQPCFDGAQIPYRATAEAIAEPWEANTRSFADGKVRIAVMDTFEPAYGAYYLMVMYWAGDESELRICDLVSQGEVGFVGMTLEGMEASYKPGLGLVLRVPTTFYNPAEDEFEEGVIEVVIDRAANRIMASRP